MVGYEWLVEGKIFMHKGMNVWQRNKLVQIRLAFSQYAAPRAGGLRTNTYTTNMTTHNIGMLQYDLYFTDKIKGN